MMPRRYELSDFEWSMIQPLLPNKPRGVPSDDRKCSRGFTGGSLRFALGRDTRALRTFDDLLIAFALGQDRRLGPYIRSDSKAYDGDLQMIDSSSIRVHQHGANGKKGGPKKRHPPLGTSLEAAAWGLARRTDHMIHGLVDANGLPIL